ncbi:MAG: ABC transporter permease [Jatrophihabitans sp.]|uniref:ABC transporter permease n=1 Tax=Jatrophihabitans sp. TaxID=1932789 RepID=UPI003F802663
MPPSPNNASPSPLAWTRAIRRRPSPDQLLLPLALIAAIGFFTALPSSRATFATRENLQAVLGDQVVTILLALAIAVPLVAGNFDFSVGNTTGMTSVAAASAMSRFHLPLFAAVTVALTVGLVVGIGNGILVGRLGLNPFITTLASGTAIGGLVQWYSGGLPINSSIAPALVTFGSDTTFGVPDVAWLLLVLAVVLAYLLERTESGRYLRAIGSNRVAADLVGIRTSALVIASFIVAALLASLAGVVQTARVGGANPGDGPGFLFAAIAAALLGSTGNKHARVTVLGTVLAALFLAACVSGLTLAGVAPWVQPVFYGCALILAMLLARHARRRAVSR